MAASATSIPTRGGPDLAIDEGRRFLCPTCREPQLITSPSATNVARCLACGWSTDDLLTLVPVRPVGFREAVLGQGPRAAMRGAVFVAACMGAAALAVAGR